MRSFTQPMAVALCAVLAGCAASADDSDREYEYVYAPVSALDPIGGGVVAVGLEPMARAFVIHPELSPDAAALVAFAEGARSRREPVHATVWIRARPPKTPPPHRSDEPWPFVIVRLGETPDPRSR